MQFAGRSCAANRLGSHVYFQFFRFLIHYLLNTNSRSSNRSYTSYYLPQHFRYKHTFSIITKRSHLSSIRISARSGTDAKSVSYNHVAFDSDVLRDADHICRNERERATAAFISYDPAERAITTFIYLITRNTRTCHTKVEEESSWQAI